MPKKNLLKIKNFVLDLLFPKICFNCREEGSYLCGNCEDKIIFFNFLNCPVCKIKTDDGIICKKCRKKSKIDRLISAAHFSDPLVKELIHSFKYNGVKSLSETLSLILLKFLEKNKCLKIPDDKTQNFAVIPVPLHWRRFQKRGFNQAELIAKEISEVLKIKTFNAIKRTKNNKPQVETKNKQERMDNVKNIFTAKNNNDIKDKIILLVDDVTTTGSTLNECAKVLKTAGAKKVWAITVAKG